MPDTSKSTTDTATAPAADGAPAAPAAEAKPKREKTPIPDGFVSPVQFAKEIDKHLNQPAGTTPPQIVYGYVKNSKTFPSQERGAEDNPRFIVDLAKGLEWIDELQKRRAERAAAKEAKATPPAEPAAAAPAKS
jgi:hypothetical protein